MDGGKMPKTVTLFVWVTSPINVCIWLILQGKENHVVKNMKEIYQYFDEKKKPITTHIHDANASITKYVEEERAPTDNSYDTCHLTKGITKQL